MPHSIRHNHNCGRLRTLAVDAVSRHRLGAVQHLFVDKRVDDVYAMLAIFLACPNVTCLDADSDLMFALADAAKIQPQRVAMRFRSLFHLAHIPATMAARITHVEGYHFRSKENPPASIWVAALLERLPALTHIAINVAGVLDDDDTPDVGDLVAVVRALLQQKQTRVVVVHVSGTKIDAWDAMTQHLGRLCDARVFAWADKRDYFDWHEEEQLCASDSRKGVDVWNSAEPLQPR